MSIASNCFQLYVQTHRWNHVFALRGFEPQDLQSLYIHMLVTAKTKDEKQSIGSFMLAGKQGWSSLNILFLAKMFVVLIHIIVVNAVS